VGGGGLFVTVARPELQRFMTSQKETGPQYPAQEGSKISGDAARSVAAQDATSGAATCIPAQAVGVPGSLGSRATGSHPPLAAKSKTAGASRSRGTSKERRLARRAAEQAAKAAPAAQPVEQPEKAVSQGTGTTPAEQAGRAVNPEKDAARVATSDDESLSSAEEDTLLGSSHTSMDTDQEGDIPASDVTAGPSTAQPPSSKRRGEAGPTPPKGRAKTTKRQGSLTCFNVKLSEKKTNSLRGKKVQALI